MSAAVWVAWEPRGGNDPYGSNPRSTVAHAGPASLATLGGITNGSFPLACGRWAPEGFDADIHQSSARRCRACERALRAQGGNHVQ